MIKEFREIKVGEIFTHNNQQWLKIKTVETDNFKINAVKFDGTFVDFFYEHQYVECETVN